MVRGDSRSSILPPAGCQEEVFWFSRSWKRGGGGTEARLRKRVLSSEVLGRRKYLVEGGSQGATRGLGGPLARPHPRARREGAWGPGGSTLAPLRDSRRFPYADFYWIFPEFL